MNKTACWVVGYGIFLIVLGLLGFLSNPAKAKSALIVGGTFGLLSILWGILLGKGFGWARWAAVVTSLFLMAALGWRAWAGWSRYYEGDPTKLVASILVTLMFAGTVGIFILLLKRAGKSQAPQP